MGRLRIRIFLFVFALSLALLVVSQQLAWRQADELAEQQQLQQLQNRGRWLVDALRLRVNNALGPQLWLPTLTDNGTDLETLQRVLRLGDFTRIERLDPDPIVVGDRAGPPTIAERVSLVVNKFDDHRRGRAFCVARTNLCGVG